MAASAISPGGFVRGKSDPVTRPVNVQVALRCRPLNARERKLGERTVVKCYDGRREVVCSGGPSGRKAVVPGGKKYSYDYVFGPAVGQEEVYETVCEPIVTEVLQGYNCTVFAYGQTGTGKTHTMEGARDEEGNLKTEESRLPESAGIIPRAIKQVFDFLRSIHEEYTVRVSHVELYNEQITDLLSASDDLQDILRIYEDPQKGTFVQGMEEVLVRSEHEIFAILEKSAAKRRTAETLMNKFSSRSHSVFTVTIHIKESTPDGQDLLKVGKLNLVDLAGSENVGRSGAIKGRAREAGNINQSLLTLGRVITSLVDHHPHVPYRDSKLTRLLQESLGGRNKTCIVATITPAASSLEETASTLDYAYRARSIKNRPQINQMITKQALLKEYNEEIVRLKAELHATRAKNGVFLPPERYEELQNTQKNQEEWIGELQSKAKEYEKRNNNLRLSLERTQNALFRNKDELRVTQEELSSTKSHLSRVKTELHEMTLSRDEACHVNACYEESGKALLGEANSLQTTLAASLSDVRSLHKRCRVKSQAERENVQAVDLLRQTILTGVNSLRESMENLQSEQETQLNTFRTNMKNLVRAQENSLNVSITGVGSMFDQLQKSRETIIASVERNASETNSRRTQHVDEMKTRYETEISGLETLKASLEDELQNLKARLDEIGASTNKLHELAESHAKSSTSLAVQYCSKANTALTVFNDKMSDQLSQQEATVHSSMESMQNFVKGRKQAAKKVREIVAAKVSEALSEITNLTDEALDAVATRSNEEATELKSIIASVRNTLASHVDKEKERHAGLQKEFEKERQDFRETAAAENQRVADMVQEVATGSDCAFEKRCEDISMAKRHAHDNAQHVAKQMTDFAMQEKHHINEEKAMFEDAVSQSRSKLDELSGKLTSENANILAMAQEVAKGADNQAQVVGNVVAKSLSKLGEAIFSPTDSFRLKVDPDAASAPPSREWRWPKTLTKLEEREVLSKQFRERRKTQSGGDGNIALADRESAERRPTPDKTDEKDSDRGKVSNSKADVENIDESNSANEKTPPAGLYHEYEVPLNDETNTLTQKTRMPRRATVPKQLGAAQNQQPSSGKRLVRSRSTQISGLRKPRIRRIRQAT